MQGRFRRGASLVGTVKCDGCGRTIMHGEAYLTIDEKPSDRINEETVYINDIECSECGNKLEDNEQYLLTIEGETEKVYCHNCLKKKGGDVFRTKKLGALLKFEKSRAESRTLHFCQGCCEKCKAGMEKKEKGEKLFTVFITRAG